MTAASAYTDRVAAVVLARLRGPKARKGTRHWSERVQSGTGDRIAGGQPAPAHIQATQAATTGLEIKQLDADYVLPDTLISEIVDTARPVALRVARDAAADAAERVGVTVPDPTSNADGMFAVDEELLADLVDEALEDMLAGAQRHAQGLREAILTGEHDGLALDELLDRVQYAAEQGGNWLRLDARTVGTALAGKASLEQARALGVTHTQWISRRDSRVRPAHVRADGQVRPVGEPFDIGGMELEYPGDPSGLPETMPQVAGCRCGLLLADIEDEFFTALSTIAAAANAGPDAAGVIDILAAAVIADQFMPIPDAVPGLPLLAAAVVTDTDLVGWRILTGMLEVGPGQQLELPAGTVLGLLAPVELEPDTLAVLIPAGTAVGISGGAVMFPEAVTVLVLAAGAGGIQGRLRGL